MFRPPATTRPIVSRIRPLVLSAALVLAAVAAQAQRPASGPAEPSPAARQALQTILAAGDHRGLPFAVVDKQAARLHVFDRDGRPLGDAPALLGQQVGDHTVPGVGDKPPSQVLPHERTTPAGRFLSEPGTNDEGDPVVWVEYDTGFAIHRVRPGRSYASRMERLRRPGADGKRASLGCVVVDGAFFDDVVRPALGGGRGMVYVLPETRPVASIFGGEVVAAR